MSRVRVHNFAVSLDGFGTGDGQSLEEPFGHGAHLMDWFKLTNAFHAMIGDADGGETGIDDAFAKAWATDIGAEIMGRNKFGPQRGPWDPEDDWTGWWGDEPPFHTPCFVLTHHPRPAIELTGTTFHFIDATPEEALAQARDAADGLDVRIGGGATTVREFLAADLVDYLHVAVVPTVLGRGERLWDDLEGLEAQFNAVTATSSPSGVTHLVFER